MIRSSRRRHGGGCSPASRHPDRSCPCRVSLRLRGAVGPGAGLPRRLSRRRPTIVRPGCVPPGSAAHDRVRTGPSYRQARAALADCGSRQRGAQRSVDSAIRARRVGLRDRNGLRRPSGDLLLGGPAFVRPRTRGGEWSRSSRRASAAAAVGVLPLGDAAVAIPQGLCACGLRRSPLDHASDDSLGVSPSCGASSWR